VIPSHIRKMARIEAGDELDVGYVGGLVVMRKRLPLTSERVNRMLRDGRKLPEITEKDADSVAAAVERVRRRSSA
jgi:bifunctional DNA-binding transcriptional regulator/antitoxin component of YhaV-PrlF toxin-antitoxin module